MLSYGYRRGKTEDQAGYIEMVFLMLISHQHT
jgi:hypothetical protein